MMQTVMEDKTKEGLLQDGVHTDRDDLIVFRWLDRQISNKKAITACLLVLQGSACSEALLGEGQAVGT